MYRKCSFKYRALIKQQDTAPDFYNDLLSIIIQSGSILTCPFQKFFLGFGK